MTHTKANCKKKKKPNRWKFTLKYFYYSVQMTVIKGIWFDYFYSVFFLFRLFFVVTLYSNSILSRLKQKTYFYWLFYVTCLNPVTFYTHFRKVRHCINWQLYKFYEYASFLYAQQVTDPIEVNETEVTAVDRLPNWWIEEYQKIKK